MALRAKKTDYHPVCQGIEFPLYFNGHLGYPKNLVLANEKLIEGALLAPLPISDFLLTLKNTQ
ncbi:hypothetical protein VARIO8X_60477 [Burkholderiales bacterium 8X]|nr:hypothetical protein VARIO8X_60477 [Burkholderiales bacterium 8X]